MSSGDVYEEEDFLLATSGFDLGFAAVVSDSAAVVDGAAPEAVVFVDWPESAIVKWQAELAQGDAVDVACPPAPPAKVTVKSFDPLA